MARELKPCGTPAAARRHRRNNEPLCEQCEQAVRDEKNGRKNAERQESAKAVADALTEVEQVEAVDALEEARDSLSIVKAVLRSGEAPANTIASLTKRRDELVDRIQGIESERKPVEVSVIDELTQRRRERVAKAAS